MASDIVPIQLSLTEGDLVTLWAPRWREDGEEWEAFLGDDDSLFAFPEVAQLAAFVRTDDAHDLGDQREALLGATETGSEDYRGRARDRLEDRLGGVAG